MQKYYVAGIFGSTVIGFYIAYLMVFILTYDRYDVPQISPFYLVGSMVALPFGILAGYIGQRLSKKFARSKLHEGLFVMLTMILGVIFYMLISIALHLYAYRFE